MGHARLVLDHLLALPRDHEDDLLGARMIVPRMPLPRRQVDHAARELGGTIDLGPDSERQPPPVETEGADIARVDEIAVRAGFLAHGLAPLLKDLNASTCALMASSTGSR